MCSYNSLYVNYNTDFSKCKTYLTTLSGIQNFVQFLLLASSFRNFPNWLNEINGAVISSAVVFFSSFTSMLN